MSGNSVNGIPRVDLPSRPLWKRNLSWRMGGRLIVTKPGAAFYRRVVVPLEAPVIKATRGRLRPSFTAPIVILTSTGARTGRRWETPLAYFTDGDDVILIASNWGRPRHPAWYHNLRANPQCELHIGPRGGVFVAREAEGADRDRLFALPADRLNKAFHIYRQRNRGIRTIPVMRLKPVPSPPEHSP